VKAVFIELPAFERHREKYLDDAAFRELQQQLMNNPDAGEAIQGTGGLRKLRFADARRVKASAAVCALFTIGGRMECSAGCLRSTTRMRCQI